MKGDRYPHREEHPLLQWCLERSGEVQLAAAVGDEAYQHLRRCRRRRCRRCEEDIAWVESPVTVETLRHFYAFVNLSSILGVQQRFLRQFFQPVVEAAKVRLRREESRCQTNTNSTWGRESDYGTVNGTSLGCYRVQGRWVSSGVDTEPS